jgi:hypothetical protein
VEDAETAVEEEVEDAIGTTDAAGAALLEDLIE